MGTTWWGARARRERPTVRRSDEPDVAELVVVDDSPARRAVPAGFDLTAAGAVLEAVAVLRAGGPPVREKAQRAGELELACPQCLEGAGGRLAQLFQSGIQIQQVEVTAGIEQLLMLVLAVQLNKRYSRGLQAGLAYTWSHAIDFNQSGASSWFFRHSFSAELGYDPFPVPNMGINTDTDVQQGVLSYVRVFGPTKVNEIKAGLMRLENSHISPRANTVNVVKELGINIPSDNPLYWGVPNINIQNIAGLGEESDAPFINYDTTIQLLREQGVDVVL